ncbi:Six-hairpin glycosidase [Meredithblackwellia eburnea MCA 4105]
MLVRSALLSIILIKSLASASTSSYISPDQSPAVALHSSSATEDPVQSTYLHFPHDSPRLGNAFIPKSDTNQDYYNFEGLSPPENPTNPAPAWARHPLAPPLPPHKRQILAKRANQIQIDAPYPPAAYIDINNLTTIAILAEAAVARMQTWYTGGQYEWTGWWQIPVIGMAYTALDNALGNRVNELLIKDLLYKNGGVGYMIDKYVDDQSWWAMFALRAYEVYGNNTWLQQAVNISVNNTLYWDQTCGGGVLWLTYRPKIKNTITNGLYFGILARLYRYTGDLQYFNYAMNTLNWWLSWAFDAPTGRVWDTITAPTDWNPDYPSACNVTGLETWTYNSGAFLFGLADLYYATGNTTLLDLGRTIAYAAMRDFSDQSTGVVIESCEHDPQPSSDLPPGCQQDETMFKGILMMGMAELYVARPDSNIYNFVNTQLLSVVFNDIDDTWLFGEWWNGPWNETTAGPKTQGNTLAMVSAAAMINRAFLSKVGHSTAVQGVSSQVTVPSNTSSGVGNAGSTARSTGVSAASSRTRGPVGEGRVSLLVGIGMAVGAGMVLLTGPLA